MTDKIENPPAFPKLKGFTSNYGQLTANYDLGCMSLRDYFAAAALTGLLAARSTSCAPEISYQLADQMLKERLK